MIIKQPNKEQRDIGRVLSAVCRLWLDGTNRVTLTEEDRAYELGLVRRFIAHAVPSAPAGGDTDA